MPSESRASLLREAVESAPVSERQREKTLKNLPNAPEARVAQILDDFAWIKQRMPGVLAAHSAPADMPRIMAAVRVDSDQTSEAYAAREKIAELIRQFAGQPQTRMAAMAREIEPEFERSMAAVLIAPVVALGLGFVAGRRLRRR